MRAFYWKLTQNYKCLQLLGHTTFVQSEALQLKPQSLYPNNQISIKDRDIASLHVMTSVVEVMTSVVEVMTCIKSNSKEVKSYFKHQSLCNYVVTIRQCSV